jgi:hypothetical protein
MGSKGCPETSVGNYHYSLRNNREERSCLLLGGGSLKSRIPTASCFVGLKRAERQGEHPLFVLRISSCNVRLPSPVRVCVCVCVCVCEEASHVRVVTTPKGYFFVVVASLSRVEGIPFHPTKPY